MRSNITPFLKKGATFENPWKAFGEQFNESESLEQEEIRERSDFFLKSFNKEKEK